MSIDCVAFVFVLVERWMLYVCMSRCVLAFESEW